ncbi:hypothetical protein EVAR_41547_1 [Eumeta japonica]|uniref:Uncharacterized protein n=1 Tax=Eumeta variegata TaxID=151549 RepID=A0A4C1X6J3_EUMVA|nr:hypothetical protein EVAR_41547_1 [Eumeta japonica]
MNLRKCTVTPKGSTACEGESTNTPEMPEPKCPAVCLERIQNPPVPPLDKMKCNPKCQKPTKEEMRKLCIPPPPDDEDDDVPCPRKNPCPNRYNK